MKRKTLLQIILIIAIIFLARWYQQQDLLHNDAPIFSSQTLTGELLNSNSVDAPVLVHFWATWCSICHYENDNVQNLAKDYKVINIAISSGSDSKIIKYAQENNLALDNIINDTSGSLADIFGVKGTPTSFFIKNNHIHFIEVGYTTEIGMRLRMWLLDVFY